MHKLQPAGGIIFFICKTKLLIKKKNETQTIPFFEKHENLN